MKKRTRSKPPRATILCGDALRNPYPDRSIDLVFCSPPYEDARQYGIDFNYKGDGWVEWAFPRFLECLRVCRGLVAWVVGGRTSKFKWSAVPALLVARLHYSGVNLRNPPIFHRVGIPGSGGPDWWRSDYDWIICATNGGKLPWSDNTATGQPCKYGPGGVPSHRMKDGTRVNAKKTTTSGYQHDGSLRVIQKDYCPPEKANPGNVVHCAVGGGKLGHPLAHENEAPFPEALVEPFVLSFCPPGGIVLDPFGGSGTTMAVALRHDRRAISMDIRQSQCDLTAKRCGLERPEATEG